MGLQSLDVGNEGGFPFRGGELGIHEAVCGAAGGGERCFYLRCTLLRLLPCVYVLEDKAVGVEFCEVLYSGGPRLGG